MDTIAYCIGRDKKKPESSVEFAKKAEFSKIVKFSSLSDFEEQNFNSPICFFLFEQVSDISSLREFIDPIRTNKRNNLRFSPLIYLCDKSSPKAIHDGISMGFDDVIVMPFDKKNITPRLNQQLNKITPYFETSQYFGPDRRRLNQNEGVVKTERRKGMQYHSYKFIRNLNNGIIIKSRKILSS